jgi:hypothetical protein
MKILKTLLTLLLFSAAANSQNLNTVINAASNYVNNVGVNISNDEVVKGLKEALSVGVKNSSTKAAALDGFNKNNLIRIPPIFINAITSMSLTDGVSLIKGGDNAATKYLQDKTTNDLKASFAPIVAKSLNEVKITKYWNPLATRYNKLPMVKKANPNLEEYVTLKAMEGLFKLVAQEELRIRKDPASRISDLLKKVFG